VSVDVAKAKPTFVEVVPEQAETLKQVERVGGKFLASYLKDAHAEVRVFNDAGAAAGVVQLPGLGTVWLTDGDDARAETFFSYESFHEPRRVLRYDIAHNSSQVFREPRVKFSLTLTRPRKFSSRAKTARRIPMFVTHKKGLKAGPDTRCLLYGYGGFDISITPSFGVGNLTWLELGGVLAVPNLRGGGEYGESWHEAGKEGEQAKCVR